MGSAHHLVAGSRVGAVPVFAKNGEKLGRIEDLMIEKVSGRTAYALMSFDGFLGVGERYYPIPWAMLDYNPEKRGYVVPLTRAQIEGAHHVGDRDVEDEIEWREAVHAYYGAAGYWNSPLGY